MTPSLSHQLILPFSAGEINRNRLPLYAFGAQGGNVQKISKYQERATECRKMAARTRSSYHKEQLEEIARAWEMLADVRWKQVERRLRRGPSWNGRGTVGSD